MPSEEYDETQYAGNILSKGVAGAGAGAQAGGPWGALIGGLGGMAVGGYQSYLEEQELAEAMQQQRDLESDLDNANANFELYLQDQALAQGIARQDAELAARQGAARGGLTPAAAESLALEAKTDTDRSYFAQRGPVLQAAKQAELAERAQILDEYADAQALADQALSGSEQVDSLFGGVTSGIGALGQMGAFSDYQVGQAEAADAPTDPAMTDAEINALYDGDAADYDQASIDAAYTDAVANTAADAETDAFIDSLGGAGSVEPGAGASLVEALEGGATAADPGALVPPGMAPGASGGSEGTRGAKTSQEGAQSASGAPAPRLPGRGPQAEAATEPVAGIYQRSWVDFSPDERKSVVQAQLAGGQMIQTISPTGQTVFMPTEGHVYFDPGNPLDQRVIPIAELTTSQGAEGGMTPEQIQQVITRDFRGGQQAAGEQGQPRAATPTSPSPASQVPTRVRPENKTTVRQMDMAYIDTLEGDKRQEAIESLTEQVLQDEDSIQQYVDRDRIDPRTGTKAPVSDQEMMDRFGGQPASSRGVDEFIPQPLVPAFESEEVQAILSIENPAGRRLAIEALLADAERKATGE